MEDVDRRVSRRMVCIAGIAMLCGTAAVSAASVIEISDCAQLVQLEDANRYRLAADVDCTQESDRVLTVPIGGTLLLDGHTLTGADVFCIGKCRVTGPGRIEGGGILTDDRAIVRAVDIFGSPSSGVVASNHRGSGRVTLVDSTVSLCAEYGVVVDRHAKLIRSTVMHNGLHGVSITKHVSNDCDRGRIVAWESDVRVNGVEGDCGDDEICADFATCDARGAKLHGTVCNHSRQIGSGMPGHSCGVCDFD